jgi:hypothetical protein
LSANISIFKDQTWHKSSLGVGAGFKFVELNGNTLPQEEIIRKE